MPRRLTDRDLVRINNALHHENAPLPPLKNKRGNEESRMQCKLIQWWGLAHHVRFGAPVHLLFSIPNGGWRDPIGAAILKREGQRNGVCDLFLAIPSRCYNGLFIEMKQLGGRVSPEQVAFMKDVNAQFYCARVCYSFEQATELIERYLKGEQVI